MSPGPPKYVQRFARLPQVLELLADYPNGLPLDELADKVGAPDGELRQDLLAFYSADLVEFGFDRPPATLEFLGPEGGDEDPYEAEIVRISGDPGLDELGVHYVSASELALLFSAARALQDLDPSDEHLAAAVDVLAETMYGEEDARETPEHKRWNECLDPLHQAVQEHRRVRIVYSRAWQSGVRERVIEPYQLVNTRRGWEVDAGPVDERGAIRTYLLANVRRAELLPDRFVPPDDLTGVLARQRETTRVRARLPQSARWTAEMYAENVCVVADDEEFCTLDLDLLPPLEHRVGLLLVAAGSTAELLEPTELRSAGADLAQELLDHHRRTTDTWSS
ncbi:MAG: WYL domain-containing protein [Nocardioides sp.]|nr:WYL domain-containing protein [Nocardioides sp.]